MHWCCCWIPSYLSLFVSPGICAVILPTAFCMLSKFCNLFYLQTRPVPTARWCSFKPTRKENLLCLSSLLFFPKKYVYFLLILKYYRSLCYLQHLSVPLTTLVFTDFKNGKIINFWFHIYVAECTEV
jgi:hypothetical protein